MRALGGQSFRTRRTVQNTWYMDQAVRRLGMLDEPFPDQYRWLMDPDKQGQGVPATRGCKRTILSELGRIDGDADLRAVADYLCEHKPGVERAVKLIREVRRRLKAGQ